MRKLGAIGTVTALVVLFAYSVAWRSTEAALSDTVRAVCQDGSISGTVRVGDMGDQLAYIQLNLFQVAGDVEVGVEDQRLPFVPGQTDTPFVFAAAAEPGATYRVTSSGFTYANILVTCESPASTPAASLATTPLATPLATPVGTRIATPLATT